MDGVEKVKFKKEKHLAVNSSSCNKYMFEYGGCWLLFFKVACVPEKKGFISANSNVVKKSDPLYKQKSWYFKEKSRSGI